MIIYIFTACELSCKCNANKQNQNRNTNRHSNNQAVTTVSKNISIKSTDCSVSPFKQIYHIDLSRVRYKLTNSLILLLLLLGRLSATNHVSVPDAPIPHQCGQLRHVSRTRVPLQGVHIFRGQILTSNFGSRKGLTLA